jgi:rare lipoprotein A
VFTAEQYRATAVECAEMLKHTDMSPFRIGWSVLYRRAFVKQATVTHVTWLTTLLGQPSALPDKDHGQKGTLLVVALLQVALLRPTSAGERKTDECGLASVYSTVSEETASGKDTRSGVLTAAHRSLPFGTMVHVENRENGHSAVVQITDRGPFIGGRVIDVARAAAGELGFSGLTQVCLSILSIPDQ